MDAMASQITNLTIVYSTVYSGADKKKKTWKLRVTGLCAGNWPVHLAHKGQWRAKCFHLMTSSLVWLTLQDVGISISNKHYRCHDHDIKWQHFFRVTGPVCGEFTGHRWIPFTKASDAELCFLWSEQTFKQTIETPVIRDAIALIGTSQLHIIFVDLGEYFAHAFNCKHAFRYISWEY